MRDYPTIRRILILTMLLNWLAMAAKLAVGYRTGTLSLAADGLDSFFDGFSNVVGLAAIGLAARPPDREHPYGHRKYETIAALSIAGLMTITTWELLKESIGRFANPQRPEVTIWSFAALVFSIVLQGGASSYEFRQGRRQRSELLIADARHSGANILISVAVLAGLPFLRLGYTWVDPALALVVTVVMAKLGYDIVRDSTPVLVDRAPLDPDDIARVVDTVEGVTSYHRIRSHGTVDEAAVDLHVRVGPDLPVARANAIADQVRDRLLKQVEGVHDVTVHVEAQRQQEASAAELYAAIQQAAAAHPVTIHEVWTYVDDDGKTRAEAHIGVPPALTVAEAHALVSEIERAALAEVPWVSSLHTHIEPAVHELVPGKLLSLDQSHPVGAAVREAVAAVPGLRQPGNLLVRNTPEGLFLSFDCVAEPGLSVSASHALTHAVSEGLRKKLPNVLEVAVRVKPEQP
jgi:cation diffusion facilitator family transporter